MLKHVIIVMLFTATITSFLICIGFGLGYGLEMGYQAAVSDSACK